MLRNISVYAVLWLLMLTPLTGIAQELNCKVTVLTQRLQTADPRVFKTLETAIFEYMNNRKWTSDVFQPHERIECNILINVTDEIGTNTYKATASIQVARPGFNSSYNSPTLNHSDKEWVFEYVEFQPIIFNENSYTDNLSSLLAYYAYLVIGLDYDTYSLKGGTPYFQKAQTILNNVPTNENIPGWRPFDSQRNRYWIIENLLNPRYDVMREVSYQYHRQGIDLMYENVTNGRQVILNSLQKMEKLVTDFPNTMVFQMFFNSKREELINMFSGASPNEKNTAINLLKKIDATNQDKYDAIK